MKPIIGIAGNERSIEDGETFWLSYTAKNFVEGIQDANGLPTIIPIGDPKDAKKYISTIDKLLLGGGHDVHPSFYKQEPHPLLEETHQKRDAFELALIKEAVKQKKPILGICRGFQLLNVAFGGTLFQDLQLYPEKTLPHAQKSNLRQVSHTVSIEKDSHLGNFLPLNYQVNSIHHQLIDQVADEFKIIAKAPNQVIEGIESLNHPILGIQWHPELTKDTIANEQAVFDYFVNKLE